MRELIIRKAGEAHRFKPGRDPVPASPLPFCVLLVLIGLPLGCSRPPSPPPGGPCTYASYQARIVVSALQPDQSDGYWMFYKASFTQTAPASAYYDPQKDAIHLRNPAGPTDLDWLKLQGIVPGASFDMSLSVLATGSCTPVVHRVPALPFVLN